MTNDHNWNGTNKHYSMMLISKPTVITTGPKYFPSDMNGADDDDSDTEEMSGHTHKEPNTKHKCTISQCRNTTNNKTKKKQRGNTNKQKDGIG